MRIRSDASRSYFVLMETTSPAVPGGLRPAIRLSRADIVIEFDLNLGQGRCGEGEASTPAAESLSTRRRAGENRLLVSLRLEQRPEAASHLGLLEEVRGVGALKRAHRHIGAANHVAFTARPHGQRIPAIPEGYSQHQVRVGCLHRAGLPLAQGAVFAGRGRA